MFVYVKGACPGRETGNSLVIVNPSSSTIKGHHQEHAKPIFSVVDFCFFFSSRIFSFAIFCHMVREEVFILRCFLYYFYFFSFSLDRTARDGFYFIFILFLFYFLILFRPEGRYPWLTGTRVVESRMCRNR